MWWTITWPLFVAAWAFLFVFFTYCYFGRGGTGTDRSRGAVGPVRRSLRWVSYLSVGVAGLIVVVSGRTWLEWGHLHARGVPVRAKVMSVEEEYDPILERYVTHVIYVFEAEVGGELLQFRRNGELSGRHSMLSGFINVLYDPSDPAHSRMTREFRGPRDGMVAVAEFLALGVACFLLSRSRGRIAKHEPPRAPSDFNKT